MSDNEQAIALLMALRRQGITDARVLGAIETVPRALFMPADLAAQAAADTALPIACGQTISQPYVVAFMTEALRVGPQHRVLEIGTGSGYQTAVLARLCRRVYTIERHRPLLKAAEQTIETLKLSNVTTRHGDGWKGWPEAAPFDRILVTAAAETVPQALVEQLKPGGVMVLPVGASTDSQRLMRIIRDETGTTSEALLPVRFVPMVHGLPQDGRTP